MNKKPLLWHVEDVGRAVLFRPLYVEVTGDLLAGLLLSQIVWWFKPSLTGAPKPYLTLYDGRFWLAKRRETWRVEVGISPKQFDRACDHLVALGIVERKVMMRGRAPMVHLALNVDKLSKLMGPFCHLGKNMGIPQTSISDIPQKAITIDKKKFKTNSSGEKAMANAKEVHEQLKEKAKMIPDTLPTNRVKPMVLAIYWGKLMSREFDTFVPPATAKELGQFAHWIKKAGVSRAYPVMKWAIMHWPDIVREVRDQKEMAVGSKPLIGSLLTHADIAVTIAGQLDSGPKKVQLIAPAKKPTKVKFVFGNGEEV